MKNTIELATQRELTAAEPVASGQAGRTASQRSGDALGKLRGLLLALLCLGSIGMAVELILLEHTETLAQLIPLIALGAGLIAAFLAGLRPRRGSIRLFQAMMVAFIAAGLAGLYLHYRGNVEFELEMYPGLTGWDLFWKALGGATPALAPGTMAQLGLLGLAFTYRHPALRKSAQGQHEEEAK